MESHFRANGLLRQDNMRYPFQLETISQSGAVVRLKGETRQPIRPGDSCVVTLFNDREESHINILTQVIHYSYNLVGLQFVEVEQTARQELHRIVEKVSNEKVYNPPAPSGVYHNLCFLSLRRDDVPDSTT